MYVSKFISLLLLACLLLVSLLKELLCRDITLNDLDDVDIDAIKQGSDQLLPCRDHADRVVFCLLPMQVNPMEVMKFVRIYLKKD